VKPSFWQRATSSKVLMLSIAIHLVFGRRRDLLRGAAHSDETEDDFEGGPPTVNASKRALEHKVSLGKKKAVMRRTGAGQAHHVHGSRQGRAAGVAVASLGH
jgi:hypothetical protein